MITLYVFCILESKRITEFIMIRRNDIMYVENDILDRILVLEKKVCEIEQKLM